MPYLEKEDYTISVPILHLDEIMQQAAQASGKTEDTIREESELTAQAFITSHVKDQYDIDAEFIKVAPDATRARMIIKCMVDISLYYLHHTINPRNIPALRNKAYEDCANMLKDIQEGTLTLIGVEPLPNPLPFTLMASQRKFVSKPFQDCLIYNEEQE